MQRWQSVVIAFAFSITKGNPTSVPGIKIGVQLSTFGQPFKKALQTAGALKVDSIEIDARHDLRPSEVSGTALRQIRKMLSDLNLRVVAVRFQTRRGYNCVEELDRRVAATKDAMKMAGDLGARVLVNQIGMIAESTEDPSHEMLRNVLSDLGKFSQHHGAFLACETGSEPLLNVLGLIESLPEGSLGVTLNPGNLIVNGFDLNDLRSIAKHILLVHAKDAVQDRARGRGMEVPLGRGLTDFPMIVSTLEEQHYQGDFVIEREAANSTFADLDLSVQFLRNI